MSDVARERLFDARQAFGHPATLPLVAGIVAVLVLAPLLILLLGLSGRVRGPLQQELWQRYKSWLVLTALMLAPILLGAVWTIAAVLVLSLLCYREYARATGLFREKLISLLVVMGIVALTFATLDNWYHLYVALVPLTVVLIAAAGVLPDRPHGYVQRVALGVFGFLLFGSSLGHLGLLADATHYRPVLILVLLSVELNDVFAFVSGKLLGRRKLIPNTSPNKTIGGALGALVLTTLLVVGLGGLVFAATDMAAFGHLVTLGLLLSVAGQMGDLVLSSIKRDIGIKDMGTVIPGHGGLLDRFDSLILAAPVVFHYVKYVNDIGADQPVRLLTGD